MTNAYVPIPVHLCVCVCYILNGQSEVAHACAQKRRFRLHARFGMSCHLSQGVRGWALGKCHLCCKIYCCNPERCEIWRSVASYKEEVSLAFLHGYKACRPSRLSRAWTNEYYAVVPPIPQHQYSPWVHFWGRFWRWAFWSYCRARRAHRLKTWWVTLSVKGLWLFLCSSSTYVLSACVFVLQSEWLSMRKIIINTTSRIICICYTAYCPCSWDPCIPYENGINTCSFRSRVSRQGKRAQCAKM